MVWLELIVAAGGFLFPFPASDLHAKDQARIDLSAGGVAGCGRRRRRPLDFESVRLEYRSRLA